MDTLKEKLRLIAGIYASMVADILDRRIEFWVAENISMSSCCFGDILFLNFDEMQVIVDHMDKWVEKYGSREKVAETVIEWSYWTVEDDWDETHGMWRNHPRINLWSWLNGLRPEQIKWTEGDELTKMEMQVKVLRNVAKTYPTASIGNIIQQMESCAKEIYKRREAEIQEAMKRSPSYEEFIKMMENHATEVAGIERKK